MNNRYMLALSRNEVCDLLLACTTIVCGATNEMHDPKCPEYRREHVLPGTIAKWQKLHDKLEQQLTIQDSLSEASCFD